MYDDFPVFNENTKPLQDAVSTEQSLCGIACKIEIPKNVQEAELVSCFGTGLMTTQTHWNIV